MATRDPKESAAPPRGGRTYTLRELSALTGAQLVGDPDRLIAGVDSLEEAGPTDASFLANPRYREALLKTRAGVICLSSQLAPPEGKNLLLSDQPSATFQQLVELFLASPGSAFSGIHPTAVIDPSAQLGEGVSIGPYCVIDRDVVIGAHTCLAPFVSVGVGATIGSHCLLHPHVVVRDRSQLGDRVILQPGAVVGSCGFGYVTEASGSHTKLQQLGHVAIEDDVEVGANTTVDRARFKVTRIGRGTKIDNLVQIGHNASLGEHNIIVSQTGISGSVKTGRHVIMGGQAGIVGHIEIADGVMIATRGGVSKSIKKAGKYAGGPVMELDEYNRQQVHLRRIAAYVRRIEELEERLAALEKKMEASSLQ